MRNRAGISTSNLPSVFNEIWSISKKKGFVKAKTLFYMFDIIIFYLDGANIIILDLNQNDTPKKIDYRLINLSCFFSLRATIPT